MNKRKEIDVYSININCNSTIFYFLIIKKWMDNFN